MLKIFLKIITLLGITNSLRIIILEMFFLNSLVIFVFLLVNISNLLTYFRGFSSFLQLYLSTTKHVKSADWDIILTWPKLFNSKNTRNIVRSTYIEVANIGSIYIKNIYANKDTSAKKSSFARGTYIKGVFV